MYRLGKIDFSASPSAIPIDLHIGLASEITVPPAKVMVAVLNDNTQSNKKRNSIKSSSNNKPGGDKSSKDQTSHSCPGSTIAVAGFIHSLVVGFVVAVNVICFHPTV